MQDTARSCTHGQHHSGSMPAAYWSALFLLKTKWISLLTHGMMKFAAGGGRRRSAHLWRNVWVPGTQEVVGRR